MRDDALLHLFLRTEIAFILKCFQLDLCTLVHAKPVREGILRRQQRRMLPPSFIHMEHATIRNRDIRQVYLDRASAEFDQWNVTLQRLEAKHGETVEVRAGIAPAYGGFADPCLTAWLPDHASIIALYGVIFESASCI